MLNISHIIDEHQAVMHHVKDMVPQITRVAEKMTQAILRGGKLFWMGNGGSAADSQHLAAELIGRFEKERRSIPSIALSTDTSILTCLTNDYDYSIVFSRQLEALCTAKDVVVGLSTSGNSQNVIAGINTAKKIGALTIGLSGHQGGRLVDCAEECLVIPSNSTGRIQEAHITIGHILCQWIEQAVFLAEEQQRLSDTVTA